MIEQVGMLGGLLLAICGLPELLRSIKRGRCDIGWGMLFCWTLGEYLMLSYVITVTPTLPLLVNYGANVAICTGLCYYRWIGGLR